MGRTFNVHRLHRVGALAVLLAGSSYAQFENAPSPTLPENPFDRAVAHPIREHAAPRVLQGARRAREREPVPEADAQAGTLQTGDLAAWPRLYSAGGLVVTGSLTGTVGLFKMWRNVFGKPPALVTPGYVADPAWGEFFLEPGLTAQYTLSPAARLYGGFAYMATGTRGTDYGGVGNTYHGDREHLYAGVNWRDAGRGLALDVSYGQQDYSVGNALLIAAGASNGAQVGASYLGPRSSWANAGLVKATWRDANLQAFYLKPNETTSAATGTRLEGVNVEWLGAGPVRLGAMYVFARESDIVTRDRLNTYDLRFRVHPVTAAPHFWVQGEYAWQRKENVAADGWYVQATFNALDAPWKPLVSARYASFSGDRPGTSKWEGFDSLYYGGSNPDWYQGKIGATLFGNTNVDSAVATVTLTPNANNILQFIYLYFAADEINSPLTIPAAGASPVSGGGVPAKPLASEFDAVYTVTINKNVNINAFAAYAAPGSGYRQLYERSGGVANGWWAVGTQFNISY